MTDEEKRTSEEEEKGEAQPVPGSAQEDSEAGSADASKTGSADPEGSGATHATSGEHGADDDHGHAHPLSMPLLGGVLGALIILTVLTVGVTAIDLGSQGNFIVAMVIATVKAVLVMGFFMHMFWDSKFNVVAFTSSFLFVLLFLAMSTLDRAEYREKIDTFEADQKTQAQN